jgi:hypothetical protein
MADLIFPPNPQPGEIYDAPNDIQYIWNDVKGCWDANAITGSGMLPRGGDVGSVLTKQSTVDFDALWEPTVNGGEDIQGDWQ